MKFIYAKVQVTVKDGLMTDIELLEYRHDRGEGAQQVIDRILEQQTIDVDGISGATNSSTVIKKAVDNALGKSLVTPEIPEGQSP